MLCVCRWEDMWMAAEKNKVGLLGGKERDRERKDVVG